jgi:hypothetical protein
MSDEERGGEDEGDSLVHVDWGFCLWLFSER